MDTDIIRAQFPILTRMVGKRQLVYLDSAASSQTPIRVIGAIDDMYLHHKANVHRGVHTLSREATDLQEIARERIRSFINARSTTEIIFTRGSTEAINLVASSFGSVIASNVKPESKGNIILTVMEHHANIVPWQLLCQRTGMELRVVDINEDGTLKLDRYRELFDDNTQFATFTHVSNVLGTVNPVKDMIEYAHSREVPCLIDGAQAAPHFQIDVQDLDADFYVFSLHKMYGPTGIGVLYGREKLLERMPPYQGGGEMIKHVSFSGTTYADLPFKFEAGTPDYVGIAALPKALDFIEEIGFDYIHQVEQDLLRYATEKLLSIPGVVIYGTASDKDSVISFNVEGLHNSDIGVLLDNQGVAVRTGTHCAQPLMQRYGIPGTVRASFAVYNTMEEINMFISALNKSLAILRM